MTHLLPSAPWWRTAVTYQLYVRSFADSDGDGIGDLDGIRLHLDHLAGLGVDAVWLNPCYPSPQADHGYDVADYRAIDPAYGDLGRFDALVAAAREAGIKVLMDLVPNHCSDQHAWFLAALAAGPNSPERARFWFRDGRGVDGREPPNNWQAWFGGPAWTRVIEADGRPGQWYLHLFTPRQPDFNWYHPDVRDEFDDVIRFWLDRGVEGFRVDAVIVVGKDPTLPDAPAVPEGARATDVTGHNPYTVHRPEGHEIWRRWRAVTDDYAARHPGRDPFFVAEAFSPTPEVFASYVRPDEFHQAFSFDLLLAGWRADHVRRAVGDGVRLAQDFGVRLAWTLDNHDTQRSVTRYGRADATSAAAWTGNNLVSSDAPVDEAVGLRRSRAQLLVLLALPGSVFLYQGQELGLPEVLDIAEDRLTDPIWERSGHTERGRDGCRVPLPWTKDAAGAHGFSPVTDDAGGGEPWLPVPATGWGERSVEAAEADHTSLLALTRALVAQRRQVPAIHGELFTWIDVGDPDVLAFCRPADPDGGPGRAGTLAVVVNYGPADAKLPAELAGGQVLACSGALDPHDPDRLPSDTAIWLGW